MTPAPTGLALVQDFLNTAGGGRQDRLRDATAANKWWREARAQWAADRGEVVPDTELDDRDAQQLRTLRHELKQALYGRVTEHGDDHGKPLARVATQLDIGTDGSVSARPTGTRSAAVRSALAVEMMRAQIVDEWRRLKVCRNTSCEVVFYDRSRNNSGVWHDVLVCGNAANLRASRARRRPTSTPEG
ncbi:MULTISPECIES: CGNR zinc finger domain-containing protein [unclassified Curtobacterium]|uniref:CGNR zinc finger domain-containing protein n=1 Tax=unclassified Curtobacterium TaxID=257496 RepID=UPI001C646662|nr:MULTISPECIES: CGNR zinc finger domain-containing protein [unclassified Curtobacterium]